MTSYQMSAKRKNKMEAKFEAPLRPTQYVERILVTSILNGTYGAGTSLPAERLMADQMGVTRPTLRETLQRLASEGWIRIQHGKPTVVNDFWDQGGLSMLGTLAKYAEFLPNGFITWLLEVRVTLLPSVARLAASYQPQKMIAYLNQRPQPTDSETTYAAYDWDLQMRMARESGNPIYALILNDFASIFQKMALRYFKSQKSRKVSCQYYQDLARAIRRKNKSIEAVVKAAMLQSIDIWQEIKTSDAKRQG